MRVIHCWPGDTETGLPPEAQTALLELLMDGFESEATARADWEVFGTVLLILEADDEIELLPSDMQLQITFAKYYPDEYHCLTDKYQISLVISNDETGSYYLVESNSE